MVRVDAAAGQQRLAELLEVGEERPVPQVTFGILGSVVFDMEVHGGPLPAGVHSANQLDASVMIRCSEEEARAHGAVVARSGS
jgi:hypothetical protein